MLLGHTLPTLQVLCYAVCVCPASGHVFCLQSLLVPSTEYAQGHAEGAGNFSIKLGAIHDLTNGSANVTQLICSALNAIAPSLSEDGEMLPENIETTIETILVVHGMSLMLLLY